LKYAHKKFRKEKGKTLGEIDGMKRKSVITGPENPSLKRLCLDEFVVARQDESNPEDSLNCLQLSNSHLDFDWVLDDLRIKFEEKWNKINFGEQVISEYIQFCENKKEFQPAFWHVVNLNLRKRCINFLTSLDLFDALSARKMFDLFKKNLYKASMLAYIFIINLPSAEEEIKFIMGNQDILQWNSRDQGLAGSGVAFSVMIQFMPMPDDKRFSFHRKVFENCHPVFEDKTVIMLMLLYVISNNEDDWNIRRIRRKILSLLERHLHSKSPNGVSFEMQNVKYGIDSLQSLSEVFQLSFPK